MVTEELITSGIDTNSIPQPERISCLTAREREVLYLIALGRDIPAICKTLGIGRSAVNKHITSIKAKLPDHLGQTQPAAVAWFLCGYSDAEGEQSIGQHPIKGLLIPRFVSPVVDHQQNARNLSEVFYSIAPYLGCENGMNWEELEINHRTNSEDPQGSMRFAVDKGADLLKTSEASVYVALGPGTGKIDAQLMQKLPGRPRYIGVDVSHYLISLSQQSILNVRVPYACDLLANFETELEQIVDVVNSYRRRNSPIVYSMTGNTATNLHDGEKRFITNWCALAEKGDMLLLEARLTGDGWELEKDHWYDVESWNIGWNEQECEVTRPPGEIGELNASKAKFIFGALTRMSETANLQRAQFYCDVASELKPAWPAKVPAAFGGTSWELKWGGKTKVLRTVRYHEQGIMEAFDIAPEKWNLAEAETPMRYGVFRTENQNLVEYMGHRVSSIHPQTKLHGYAFLLRKAK